MYTGMLASTRGKSIDCHIVGNFLSNLTGFKERLQQEAELYHQTVKGADCRLLGTTLNESVLGFSREHRLY